LLLLLLLASAGAVFAVPDGVANISVVSSERKTALNGTSITAQGGNITRLNITMNAPTRTWQGFAGNITGSLALDDASGDRFYSWNLSNVSGEIYASRNGTIDWTLISVQNACTVDEVLTGTGSDRVNRTYTASANTVNFSVGAIEINSSTSCSARPFINSTRQSTTNLFENIIISRGNVPNGNQSIFVGILQGTGVAGFDAQEYNFQLLVPVNRTSGFTTYYMYAELE